MYVKLHLTESTTSSDVLRACIIDCVVWGHSDSLIRPNRFLTATAAEVATTVTTAVYIAVSWSIVRYTSPCMIDREAPPTLDLLQCFVSHVGGAEIKHCRQCFREMKHFI